MHSDALLMPILEEKWYQQSTSWSSDGSWQVAYSSIALWSCKSPSHGKLSISIMHQWRDLEEKFCDCLATGSFSGNKGNLRMTALASSASNPPMTEARLCKSWTECWETRNSEQGLIIHTTKWFNDLVPSGRGDNRYCVVQIFIVWLVANYRYTYWSDVSTGQVA